MRLQEKRQIFVSFLTSDVFIQKRPTPPAKTLLGTWVYAHIVTVSEPYIRDLTASLASPIEYQKGSRNRITIKENNKYTKAAL